MKYENIWAAICREPWAILPEKLEEIVGVLQARAAGVTLTAEERKAFSSRKKKYGINGNVSVLPLFGTISQRIGLLTASGGTSLQEFDRDYSLALNNPDVGAILCDVDSPGGSVFGVQEMADKIRDNRGRKPQIAIANSMAASAAYWIASAFDEVVITPSGQLGSVGVVATHVDYSAQNAAEGVKVTYVTAGKYKAEGNPDAPLDDEARAQFQADVDRYYAAFLEGLSQNRGVTTRTVRSDFGQGRVFGAKDAVARGMADRIATFEQVLGDLNAGRASASRRPRPRPTPGDGGSMRRRPFDVEAERKRLRQLQSGPTGRSSEAAARLRRFEALKAGPIKTTEQRRRELEALKVR